MEESCDHTSEPLEMGEDDQRNRGGERHVVVHVQRAPRPRGPGRSQEVRTSD